MSSLRAIPILFLVACGHPAPTTTPVTTTLPEPAASPATGTALKLAEITIAYGGEVALKIHADGGVEAREADGGAWKPVGKLSTEGKFVVADGQSGELQPDGTFKTPEGPAPFTLDGETLVGGGKRITIDASGGVVGGNEGAEKIKITGATDPGTKRTALLILGLLLGGSSAK